MAECSDFMEFEETLKRMRAVDDKIVYMLNTSIPTESFKGQVDASSSCRSLYDELQGSYNLRESAIKKCINITADRVRHLKDKKDKDSDNVEVIKNLRKEQTHLRLLQSEMHVEEVLRERTNKVYYERCRTFYKPPDLLM